MEGLELREEPYLARLDWDLMDPITLMLLLFL